MAQDRKLQKLDLPWVGKYEEQKVEQTELFAIRWRVK